jgi:polyisoprenoid-binding protein YceI
MTAAHLDKKLSEEMMMNKHVQKRIGAIVVGALLGTASMGAWAEKYAIDPAHSFIEFSISHLGVSVLKGRFNKLKGEFNYDESAPDKANIWVEVETGSVDSNHAERDKHLRSDDFLDVGEFPMARFESTSFTPNGDNGVVKGNLTLHGVTKAVTMEVTQVGAGKDPWGGYRRGYQGTMTLVRSDYGIEKSLGPQSASLELGVFIEGIRQ